MPARTPRLQSGYAFNYEGESTWKRAPNDDWETVMISDDDIAGASYVGGRMIDGTHCLVFAASGGGYFAQTAVMAGG